jgi:hypothetical protein
VAARASEYTFESHRPRSGHNRLVHVCIHHLEGRPTGSPLLQSRRAYLDAEHDGANPVYVDLGPQSFWRGGMVLHPSTPPKAVDAVLVDREAMIPAYSGVRLATDSSRLTPISPSRRDMFRTLPRVAQMTDEVRLQKAGELAAQHGQGMVLLVVFAATCKGEFPSSRCAPAQRGGLSGRTAPGKWYTRGFSMIAAS